MLASVKDKPFGWPLKGRPSLTAAARDGERDMRSGRKNAAARVEPKNETTKKGEKQRNHSLTRNTPYKPEQASKVTMRMPTLLPFGEGRVSEEAIDMRTRSIRRGSGHGTSERWFG